MSAYSRADRLFILAKVCQANNLTPDDTAYMKLIIGVCTSKLGASNDAARQYAEDLTSAYRFDKWSSILTGSESEAETPSNTTPQVCIETPTLNTYKTFTLKQPCTPIKKLSPKANAALETAPAEHEQALCILALARRDVFSGVGHVTLAQVRYELENKTLTIDDVKRLIDTQLPGIETEKRAGPSLAFYLEGKDTVRAKREAHKIVQDTPIVLAATKNEYYKEPPLEKAYFKGKKVNW